MSRINGNTITIQAKQEDLFNFLSNFENIGRLMPDQVTGFTYDSESCSFTITGMGSIGLKYRSKNPFSEIIMEKNGKAPFDFTLGCSLTLLTEGSTEVQLFMDSDMNPVMRMMAEKPLLNFINMLTAKLGSIYGSSVA